MLKQIAILIIVVALLPLVLKLAVKTRLIIPLLYMAMIGVFFPSWATAHPVLSFGILGLLLLLIVSSWLWPALSRLHEERMMKRALLLQISTARESSGEPLSVTFVDGVPIVRTNK